MLTVVGALAVTLPAMLVVTLRWPRLRPVIEGLSLLPLVIPPIALVVGVRDVLALGPDQLAGTALGDALVSSQDLDLPWVLVVVYIVLALPFVYRAFDAGLRAIDVRTLVDAARGLGASWLDRGVPGAAAQPAQLGAGRGVPDHRAGAGGVHHRGRS